jgi:hypothetical protein
LESTGVPVCPAVLSNASDAHSLLANLIKALHLDKDSPYWAYIPSTRLNLDYPIGQFPCAFVGESVKLFFLLPIFIDI